MGAILVLLGLIVAGTGVASATLWRPADHVQAEALASGATTLLVTDPGVLELVADTVTARATGPQGSNGVLVVGREADVRAWVGVDAHTRVTGLADDATLAAEPGQPFEPPVATTSPSPTADATPDDETTPDDDATPDDETTPDDDATPGDEGTTNDDATSPAAEPATLDPSDSDMWVAQAVGQTTAELEWTRQPGRWVLLVASTGADAGPPTVELTWPRTVETPWFVPGLWLGALLTVAGLGLLALGWVRARRSVEDWTEVTEPEPAVVDVPTGPLTRRQLRELEAASAAARDRGMKRRRDSRAGARLEGEPSTTASLDTASLDTASPDTASLDTASPETASLDPASPDTSAPAVPVIGEPARAATWVEPEVGDRQSASESPPAFVPTFEPRRPGGVVPHVPPSPAVPAAPWTPTGSNAGESRTAGAPFAPITADVTNPTGDAPAFVPQSPLTPTQDLVDEPAARRSRAGKFFPRRRDARTHADDAAPSTASTPAAESGHLEPPGAVPPGTATGPAAAQPGTTASPAQASGSASADAWRARWGFVEVPPTGPQEPSEQAAGTDAENPSGAQGQPGTDQDGGQR